MLQCLSVLGSEESVVAADSGSLPGASALAKATRANKAIIIIVVVLHLNNLSIRLSEGSLSEVVSARSA